MFNIMDFARVSISFAKPKELLKTIEMFKMSLKVVCIKNGYARSCSAKGSGYRDIKLIVEFDVEDDFCGYRAKSRDSTRFLCEIQLLCDEWLQNKKETSLGYKITRAKDMPTLCSDFSKYLNSNFKSDVQQSSKAFRPISKADAIKSGRVKICQYYKVSRSEAEAAGLSNYVALLDNMLSIDEDTEEGKDNVQTEKMKRDQHINKKAQFLIDLRDDNIQGVAEAIGGGFLDTMELQECFAAARKLNNKSYQLLNN